MSCKLPCLREEVRAALIREMLDSVVLVSVGRYTFRETGGHPNLYCNMQAIISFYFYAV